MNSERVWDQFEEYTKQASSCARQLAYAIGGMLWASRIDSDNWSEFTRFGLVGLGFYFVVDLAQYTVASRRWRAWARSEEIKAFEKTGEIDGEYDLPSNLDRPVHWLWGLKILLLIASFCFAVLGLLL